MKRRETHSGRGERESTDSFLHGNHTWNHGDHAANKTKKEGIYWLYKVTIKFKNKNKNLTDNIDLMCAHAYVLSPCHTIN